MKNSRILYKTKILYLTGLTNFPQHLPMDHNWQDEQILKSKIGEVLLPLIHCTIRAGVCDGSGPTRKPGFLEVP